MDYASTWQRHKASACLKSCYYCEQVVLSKAASKIAEKVNERLLPKLDRHLDRAARRRQARLASRKPVELKTLLANTAPKAAMAKPTAFQRFARRLRLPFGKGEK